MDRRGRKTVNISHKFRFVVSVIKYYNGEISKRKLFESKYPKNRTYYQKRSHFNKLKYRYERLYGTTSKSQSNKLQKWVQTVLDEEKKRPKTCLITFCEENSGKEMFMDKFFLDIILRLKSGNFDSKNHLNIVLDHALLLQIFHLRYVDITMLKSINSRK
jgi:hypothetical protein